MRSGKVCSSEQFFCCDLVQLSGAMQFCNAASERSSMSASECNAVECSAVERSACAVAFLISDRSIAAGTQEDSVRCLLLPPRAPLLLGSGRVPGLVLPSKSVASVRPRPAIILSSSSSSSLAARFDLEWNFLLLQTSKTIVYRAEKKSLYVVW